MDIFGVLTLVGGLALFLYGMETMSSALSKASGGRLEKILEKLTSNKLKGVLLGALVTAVIQSSSATTVMVVGFVNSGIMRLSQAVGVIMGANIGTTATSWILSLASLEGDSLLVQLLKPTTFTPVLAAVGVVIILFSKKDKQKDWAQILLGFAVLMFGMETMSTAVEPLASDPAFMQLFTMFQNPLLGLAAGAVLTAVIQSSSASVGILQALAGARLCPSSWARISAPASRRCCPAWARSEMPSARRWCICILTSLAQPSSWPPSTASTRWFSSRSWVRR